MGDFHAPSRRSTGNKGVEQLALKIFRMCGPLAGLVLFLALSALTGCIDQNADLREASSLNPLPVPGNASLRAEIDFNSQVGDSLLRAWGDLILWGNSSLPYIIINATWYKEGRAVSFAKYMLIDVQGGRAYGFDISKNLRLLPGDYSCTLEVVSPGGSLISQNRGCLASEFRDQTSVQPGAVGNELFAWPAEETAFQDQAATESPRAGLESSPAGSAGGEDGQVTEDSQVQVSDIQPQADEGQSAEAVDELKISDRSPNSSEDVGTSSPSGSLVGSTSSSKYHQLNCRYAAKIKPQNRVYFASIEEAVERGYEACKSCSPS